MPEFLLEVGCEELPASFVERAYSDLAEALSKELEALGVKNSEPIAMGTPRRLIISFPDLKDRQEDSVKEQRGPSLTAAYDANGNATGALLGFCKSQGITPDDLRKDEQYVWVTKQIPGQATSDVLAQILPGIILGLSFEKSMRWGTANVRFARPIRWILAAFDAKVVSFEVIGVPSSLLSCGHRFYAPDTFEARNLNELTNKLRGQFVEPEVVKRREKILAETLAVAGGTPEVSEDLLDENSFLCEWPTAIRGTFPESYLELPEPVLVTAMAKHERMFPVRDDAGKLTNAFVFIRNSGEDATVRRGCEWVLGARFNDAHFFYNQDQKLTLDDFLQKTKDIIFQAQLGTVRQRADRLAKLCRHLAEVLKTTRDDGVSSFSEEEIGWAEEAGLYAKADLSAGLVSELSSLQGVIGGEYARREGHSEAVANAIASQYKTPTFAMKNASEGIAGILIMADHLDKLAGYLGLGLEPSGSSDPYGLRKSVTVLIRVAENWEGSRLRFADLMMSAFDLYAGQGFELDKSKAMTSLSAIFKGRYETLFSDYRHDVLAAAIPEDDDVTCPMLVVGRLVKMDRLRKDSDFVQAATRPINIVSAAKKKGENMVIFAGDNFEHFGTQDAKTLWDALQNTAGETSEDAYHQTLIKAINAYFDNNMIMAEDPMVRFHRLSLASAVAERLLEIGDFTKLEG